MHDRTLGVFLIFNVLCQQHRIRAACIPRSRTTPASAQQQSLLHLQRRKILQLLVKMERRNTQLSASPLRLPTQ